MNRRKLIFRALGLVAATEILSNWHRPVISVVALPAHAQTSNVFPFGKFSGVDSCVCLEFFRHDDSVSIEAKFAVSSSRKNRYEQGSTEISIESFNKIFNNTSPRPNPDSGIQIILDRDCNGNEVNPIDSIVIENIVGEQVIFAIWVEKYLSGNEAYPGACEFDSVSCETI